MNAVLTSVRSLMQMFDGKSQELINEIDNVHMVWLEEIQQEANRMFSRDFNAEPELMPKTPSQKKNSRRKRVSVGRQEESQARRRFSKGRRSNLRGSSVKSLNLIDEEESVPEASTSDTSITSQSKRPTRKRKQTKADAEEDASLSSGAGSKAEEERNKKPEPAEEQEEDDAEVHPADAHGPVQPPPKVLAPEMVVSISPTERLSAELASKPTPSPGRTAVKIAIAGTPRARRSSARCSLKLRHSLAGLRHSMTQESVRRASRRSLMKKAARNGKSTCSSSVDESSCKESTEEEEEEPMLETASADTVDPAAPASPTKTPEIKLSQSVAPTYDYVTRSVAASSPALAPSPLFVVKQKKSSDDDLYLEPQPVRRSSRSTKRKAPDTVEESPTKKVTPPKKAQSTIRPNMRSFLHTVQKNQMLMMTPSSIGRTAVIKSFIKHNTPIKADPKAKERFKLEALKRKQEQEEERMRKMEDDKRRKQEELKRKRDERLKRVFEAKVKEEQKEEEKKKKIEQKMAQIEEKNDKRLAEERAKKKVALKRQEELELKKKLEEEARRKIQEEEKLQQKLLAKRKEEEQARKQAEAQKALELERERQAAAERERVEKEKALALQRELERAAREKEMRDLEEKRRLLEEKRKLEEQQRLAAKEQALKEREAAKQREAAAMQTSAKLNVTVDIERSVVNTPVGKAGGLNVTMDVERSALGTPVGKGGGLNVTMDVKPSSPQSYIISPKGGSKPLSSNLEDYGMDQNSEDSTDDESAPRKPIPSWAQGPTLQQLIMKQYFNPPDLESFFGAIEQPKLENIFYKSKPRYFKRTSSAVWHSPLAGAR